MTEHIPLDPRPWRYTVVVHGRAATEDEAKMRAYGNPVEYAPRPDEGVAWESGFHDGHKGRPRREGIPFPDYYKGFEDGVAEKNREDEEE